MTNDRHSRHLMPMFSIDICSSEDNEALIQTKTIFPKTRLVSRSLSLPNCGEIYQDLSDTIHYTSSNCLKNCFICSQSYRKNYFSYERSYNFQPLLAKMNFTMNLLDLNSGMYSTIGSSPPHSLYGSLFNLSDSHHHLSIVKTNYQ